ncbi:MAG: sugar transferase [Planctomycetota bacterium]|nr:sugar transferase [Planctomycetota bacterium]
MKRMLDALVSVIGLLLVSPVLAIVAGLVKFTSPGPIFFRQQRIGRGFQPFGIYKFRTMVADAPACGRAITVGNDPRITRVGRILRKTKLDELPQLINVLLGDMSLVGPRPEVAHYVEMFREDYADILQVRPGITDLASLQYRDEAAILARAENPEEEYVRRILPEKIRLAKQYVRSHSPATDLRLIGQTVLKLLGDRFRLQPQ